MARFAAMAETLPRLRIAQVAPPLEPVPPLGYGGLERVVNELLVELQRRGHAVTLFASGDSTAPVPTIATVERALRPAGLVDRFAPWTVSTALEGISRSAEFDIVHAHHESLNVLVARACPTPVVATFHGRLDTPEAAALLRHAPPGIVAISQAQADTRPEVDWSAVVHNGLTLGRAPIRERPGDALCFVGRLGPEKGAADAIEIARFAGRHLRMALKPAALPSERDYEENVLKPALKDADVEVIGELSEPDRDALMADSCATLMPGNWPEPFGLVAIESLACGTPVIARPVGGVPEIVRDGIDGFLADENAEMAAAVERVGALDRLAIRASVIDRFSAARMTDGYEAVYARRLGLTHAPIQSRINIQATKPAR
jgi:glycosyltransferase involved in cell wall biosynthesis